jgi:hypothetical protein
MAGDLEQVNENEMSSTSEETLKKYLLGELDQIERLSLDERLLADDEFAQRMSLAESELIDGYADGQLSDDERDKFANRFLITEQRRKALRLSSALKTLAESHNAAAVPVARAAKSSWRETLAHLLGFIRAPAFAWAGAAAVLIMLAGLVWFIARQARLSPAQVAGNPTLQTPAPVPQSGASPAVAAAPDTPNINPPLKTKPSEPAMSPAVASFVLMPGALRGPGQMTRVAVPRGERDILRLSLVLEQPAPGPYLAELANANGQTVTVKKNLQPHSNGHVKVTFEVPARLIQTDDYQVKLQRQSDGKIESVGRYYFRALPE